MTQKTVLISINASWNIVNFRAGLVRALQAEGYRVAALAPADGWSPRLIEMGVRYEALPMDKKGVSPARDLLLLARYLSALRRIRPDVFLGYTAKPNIYGSLAAQALGIPTINNVSGLGTAFIRETWLTRMVSFLYRLAFRRAALVFFQNEEDLALFVERRIVPAAKARLLPGSGIDLDRFSPSGQPERAPFTFLMVGRLLWDKGVGEFVAAARAAREQAPGTRFQLLGFLDAENRTAVPREDVERWVAEGLIDYLGHTDDVQPYLAAAHCVVLPSYREGLPRSLLEAAAMGKPLIATEVPGCRHLVDEGVNGFLCAPRDPGSLADAMLRMVRLDDAERAEMGAASRRKAEGEYDERIVFECYTDAIRTALARS